MKILKRLINKCNIGLDKIKLWHTQLASANWYASVDPRNVEPRNVYQVFFVDWLFGEILVYGLLLVLTVHLILLPMPWSVWPLAVVGFGLVRWLALDMLAQVCAIIRGKQ